MLAKILGHQATELNGFDNLYLVEFFPVGNGFANFFEGAFFGVGEVSLFVEETAVFDNHLAQRERDGTHFFAVAAHYAGVGNEFVVVDSFEVGEEYVGNGSGENVVVSFVAGTLENRTHLAATSAVYAGEGRTLRNEFHNVAPHVVQNEKVVGVFRGGGVENGEEFFVVIYITIFQYFKIQFQIVGVFHNLFDASNKNVYSVVVQHFDSVFVAEYEESVAFGDDFVDFEKLNVGVVAVGLHFFLFEKGIESYFRP